MFPLLSTGNETITKYGRRLLYCETETEMKIVIVSDTHGRNELMWEVVKREEPFDMFIHCGDLETEEWEIRDRIDCPLFMVPGNNDYFSQLDPIVTFDLADHRAVLTHGHRYHIHTGLSSLYYLAKENQADIVFFGHIHMPVYTTEDGVIFINPGSLSYPRQIGRVPTYAVMEVVRGEEPQVEIKYVEEELVRE